MGIPSLGNVLTKTKNEFGFPDTQKLRESIYQERVYELLTENLIKEVKTSSLEEAYARLEKEACDKFAMDFFDRIAEVIEVVIFANLPHGEIRNYALPPNSSRWVYSKWIGYRVWNAVKAIFGRSDWQLAMKKAMSNMDEIEGRKIGEALTNDASLKEIIGRIGDWQSMDTSRKLKKDWHPITQQEVIFSLKRMFNSRGLSFKIHTDHIKQSYREKRAIEEAEQYLKERMPTVQTWVEFAMMWSKAEAEGHEDLFNTHFKTLLRMFVPLPMCDVTLNIYSVRLAWLENIPRLTSTQLQILANTGAIRRLQEAQEHKTFAIQNVAGDS